MSYFSPGGKLFDSSCIVEISRSAVASAFDPGRWKIEERHGRPLIEIAVGGVVLRAELDAADILQPRHASVAHPS